jgi:hypothetical protein
LRASCTIVEPLALGLASLVRRQFARPLASGELQEQSSAARVRTKPASGSVPFGCKWSVFRWGCLRTSEGSGKILRAMTDVTIRLGTVEELFVAPTDGAFRQSNPRLQSGIDELLSELGRTRLGKVGTITIALPAAEIRQGFQEQVRAWIQSYCWLRLRETNNELGAIRQDGLRSLVAGMIVLFAGLALSALVLHSAAPNAIRTFFGEGLFVVIAWVGAWYPLDVLIYYPRPHRRTRKLLERLRLMEVLLVPADGGS